MKKKIFFLLLSTLYGASILAQQTCTFSVEVKNEWTKEQKDAPVVIRLEDVPTNFHVRSAVISDGQSEIPSQLDDLDGDLKADELAFVLDLPAQSTRKVDVVLSDRKPERTYASRVFATLLARDTKGGHHVPIQSVTVSGTVDFYNMVYGHGPMLESELVGYRVYFDKKQTVDPYGKFNKGLELKESRFYPNKEQLAHGFGDDVLMVGNSCGVGALKGWDGYKATHIEPVMSRTESVLACGPVRAIAEVKVKGWEYQGNVLNMTHRYTLYAGHRDLMVETFFDELLDKEVFATGVQNIMGGETLSYSDHHGLTGSWGRYWPVTDTVRYAKETIGLATYIPQEYVREEVKDRDNFLYTVAAPGKKYFCHYAMFTSRKETFGYPTAKAWFGYMQVWKDGLEHPVKVRILR